MEHNNNNNNNNQQVSEYEYGLPNSTGGIDSTKAGAGPYVMPPPPMGYPLRDSQQPHDSETIAQPIKTRSRGDGFWKGCCAALCCCCAIDICF